MKRLDAVQFQREEQQGRRYNNIPEVIQSASKRYLKIRSDLEVLESEKAAIVKHIKSYEDYEYFLDYVFEKYLEKTNKRYEERQPYYIFNAVEVYNDMIVLKYEPLHARFDGNNFTYGVCSTEDIVNIEDIIKTEKAKYI